jgi:hypothetical protein
LILAIFPMRYSRHDLPDNHYVADLYPPPLRRFTHHLESHTVDASTKDAGMQPSSSAYP